jgi:hypothetical protein
VSARNKESAVRQIIALRSAFDAAEWADVLRAAEAATVVKPQPEPVSADMDLRPVSQAFAVAGLVGASR